jgi:hypothetical protein
MPHDLADIDLAGRARQPQPAEPAAFGLYVSSAAEIVGDLHHVVLRNAVGARNLRNRAQLSIVSRQMDQKPE